MVMKTIFREFTSKPLYLIAFALLAFGIINLSNNVLAQSTLPAGVECQILQDGTTIGICPDSELTIWDRIILQILEQMFMVIAPIVTGVVTIGLQFAKKRGLQISGEAEDYIVKSVRSFVEKQSRFLYKEIEKNYPDYFKKGKIPPDLGEKAKQQLIEDLKVELESDEFTNTARSMITKNLDPLIERFVTESKSDHIKRARELLKEITPLAVDAAIYSLKDTKDAKQKRDQAFDLAHQRIIEHLKNEFLLVSDDIIDMYVGAEMKKKLD